MKTLKGWTRFNRTKDVLNRQLKAASTDARLVSLSVRVQVLERAIRKMNHANGAFLDKPAIPQRYSLDQMKSFQMKIKGAI
jgi:hypothetical protein